jgi:hypothetical protein
MTGPEKSGKARDVAYKRNERNGRAAVGSRLNTLSLAWRPLRRHHGDKIGKRRISENGRVVS